MLPPVARHDTCPTLTLRENELPEEVRKLKMPKLLAFNPSSRLVLHDRDENAATISCSFQGATMYHGTVGDLCSLKILIDENHRASMTEIMQKQATDVFESSEYDSNMLLALIYGGFLVSADENSF